MKAKVTILKSEDEPTIFEHGEYLIGRGDEDSETFPDLDLEPYDDQAKVSRRHAILRISSTGVTIEDIGSLNGTFINRRPRLAVNTRHDIQSGDEIAIGTTFLKIDFA